MIFLISVVTLILGAGLGCSCSLTLTESIRQLARENSIWDLDVILTDFDKQMKAALNEIFP